MQGFVLQIMTFQKNIVSFASVLKSIIILTNENDEILEGLVHALNTKKNEVRLRNINFYHKKLLQNMKRRTNVIDAPKSTVIAHYFVNNALLMI